MQLNYAELFSTISNLTVISPTDPNFLQIFPQALTYAENRINRELDLLENQARTPITLTTGSRTFVVPDTGPAGKLIVSNGLNVITPATVTSPALGTRNQMTPVSLAFLDAAWGGTARGLPLYYAPLRDDTFIIGPAPDASYTVEVIGTFQLPGLSPGPTNTVTVISANLPDLLTAGVMVFMTGYQRDWGAQSDDPSQAQSWENQYKTLFASAAVVEFRKKYSSAAWGSLSPTPIATPSR